MAVLIGEIVGIQENLFMTIPSYDILMHIAGGLGIGLALSAGIKHHSIFIGKEKLIVIVGVFIAGILWELFEIIYNISGHPFGTTLYFIDTVKDLFDDVIGGILALWLAHIPKQ